MFTEHFPCVRNYARTMLDAELARTDTIPNLNYQINNYKYNVCYEGERLWGHSVKRYILAYGSGQASCLGIIRPISANEWPCFPVHSVLALKGQIS